MYQDAYDQVNERLGDLTQAMTSLHSEVHEVETRLSEKIDTQGREFRAETQAIREEIGRLRSEMHRQAFFVVGLLGGLMVLLRFVG